jgi:hypothetical protein
VATEKILAVKTGQPQPTCLVGPSALFVPATSDIVEMFLKANMT